MKLRLVLTAVLVAVVSVVPTWLSMQPLLRRLGSGDWQGLSAQLLVLDLVVTTGIVGVVLHFVIARPIGRIERTVNELSGDEEGGEVLLRLDRALRRLALDLGEERRVNRQQLEALTASRDSLARLQSELVANDRLATVGKLAAGVAHEVGNPLAGILGYLSVLRMRAGQNAELNDLVGRIELEVQRIDQIVRSLLELGRPSRGQATAIQLKPLIDLCVKLLSVSRDFSGVQVAIEVPESTWVKAEPGPLSQVLVNLLINAAQAMGQQGHVFVRCAAVPPQLELYVDDEGPGLSAEVKARLCEPFFTTKAAGKGTGLGLAVSRHLLSQFEARLDAVNRETGGARFVVSMPAP